MNRRQFFQKTIPLGLYPLVAGSLPISSLAATSPLTINPCNVTDRSMVVIYLGGGNDIINTAIPLNQMSDYANNRPDIYIPENELITLDSTLSDSQQLGLHPSLTGFKSLYDQGELSIVQRVGYGSPNRSHFKALDNLLTGSGGGTNNQTGLWGRFLKDRYPSYNGNPFIGEPDPLGLLFGKMNKTGFHTFEQHAYEMNLSGQDPAGFYTLISSLSGEPIPTIPMTEHGGFLSHIAEIENSVNVYAERISHTFNSGANSSSAAYPDSSLGNQLKTIARMLSGGSRTKVFMATTGGFDTHVNMVDSSDAKTGKHAGLLGNVGNSIHAFQNDLKNLGLDSNVMTVVFSEFSRKIVQNSNYGLDHGTLSSMFVIGKGVEAGIIGDNIQLNDQDKRGAANPNQLQHDYRQVYSTLMQDWLGANDPSLDATFSNPSLYSQKINLVNESSLIPASCYYTPQAPIVCACIQVKLTLEGFYDTVQQTMTTNLVDSGLIPTTQPYAAAPFGYSGSESVVTFPADTVDWLFVELRNGADLSQIVAQKVVLLRKDGFVMETDGTPGVSFDGVTEGHYHLAVFHRNHLGVISSDSVLMDAPSFIYDFTAGAHTAAGEGQLKYLGTTWALFSGDVDKNQIIDNQDFNVLEENTGSTGLYHTADMNGDGNIDNQDYNLWFANRSKLGNL